uniref:Uncharacterized protein n=1 Tax=Romanomermis culicivorax TaxID=13658 RepID=A0A915I2L9_ROMCU
MILHRSSPYFMGQNLQENLFNYIYLETGGAPIDELNGSFGFDTGDRGVHVLGYHVAPIQQTDGHIFAVSRVAFNHLVVRLETHVSNVGDGQLFVIGFFGRDDLRLRNQTIRVTSVKQSASRASIRTYSNHKIGLKYSEPDILFNYCKTLLLRIISMDTSTSANGTRAKKTPARIHEFIYRQISYMASLSTIKAQSECSKVHLHLRRRVYGKFQFAFFPVIQRQTFHEQGRETAARAAAERMKDQETLQAGAIVGQSSYAVQN